MVVKALRIRIVGVVQGVGFRPFVYRLATGLGLGGYVVNLGGSEVEVFVEGDENVLRVFLDRLYSEKPPNARIEKVFVDWVEPAGFKGFFIRESGSIQILRSIIPPDIGICSDCVREILDPGTRFYRYYWNSCVNCGPRFSMMFKTPYDRENTSMAVFKLCPACEADYRDHNNIRRFHAQGISCPVCGPKTFVFDSSGRRIDVEDVVGFVVEKILEGAIVAIKGVGGYHIACLASDDSVVLELRKRKRRPAQPFAIMARDYSVVEEIAEPFDGARELLESPQRPIVILPKRRGSKLSKYVAPGLSTVGVMLPYTGFQVLLLREVPDGFLIMTSGNVHGEPMCTNIKCVFEKLGKVVDYVVEHEREIVHRVDDSVIRFADGEPVFLRRARGYAPEWIEVPFDLVESIAVGAELQTAGAVAFENKVVLTQFIGDVDEPAQLDDLRRELMWFAKIYGLKPAAVVADMHPLYHNKRLAIELSKDFGAGYTEVQHHHAHIAAAMAEHGVVDERVVGIAIDGTGYGVDGGIWGGEVMIASYTDFIRTGSLQPFVLPGGDTAALYPVKPLIALLVLAGYSEEETMRILEKRDLISSLPYREKEAEITYILAKSGRGAIVTSMGRTLDAFSALLRVCTIRTYEGEPPIRLEALADGGVYLDYEPRIRMFDGRLVVDVVDLLNWVLSNENKRESNLAATILRSLGIGLGMIALRSLKGLRNTVNTVFLSGGSAVNTHIVRGVKEALMGEGISVKLPRKVPPGDGGIALGQIVIASKRVLNNGGEH
ncbi:MAG: carbamoyltransferase HypF [Ignisphaera sp.]